MERGLLHAAAMRAVPRLRSVPDRQRLRCIVVEDGGPGLSHERCDDFDETVAIAQLPGEMPVQFAQRTLAKIANVERSGRHFEALALLTSHRQDGAAQAARRLIVLGLSNHAQARGASATLLVQAHDDADDAARRQLLELVGEVTESSAHAGMAVRLRFGQPPTREPEPKSGVFFAAALPTH